MRVAVVLINLRLIGRHRGLLRPNFLDKGSQFRLDGTQLRSLRRRGRSEYDDCAKRRPERWFHRHSIFLQEQFAFRHLNLHGFRSIGGVETACECLTRPIPLSRWPRRGCINRRIFLCNRFLRRSFSKVSSFFRRHCSNYATWCSRKWKPTRCWKSSRPIPIILPRPNPRRTIKSSRRNSISWLNSTKNGA